MTEQQMLQRERDEWKGRAELWDISNIACRAEIARLMLERERLIAQLSDVRDTLEIENNDELWIRDLLGRLDWTSQPAPLDAPDAGVNPDCTIRGVK